MWILTRKSLAGKATGHALDNRQPKPLLFQLLPRFITTCVTCRHILEYVATMTAVSDLAGLVTSLNLI